MHNSINYLTLLGLISGVLVASCANPEGGSGADPQHLSWQVYRGDEGSNAYSSLDQINRGNVKDLEVAWVYRTGDARRRSSIQCNPIVIDGLLYCTSASLKAFALDAASGEERWVFDPFPEGSALGGTNRGMVFWRDGDDQRLLYCVMDRLIALDATTGKPVESFGVNGEVDLRFGLDLDPSVDLDYAFIGNTSPGIVYGNLFITGSIVRESYGSLPGHIRAYDIRSGELKWIFHTIPHPGEFGYDTWPEGRYKTAGGANAWSGLSIDKGRGIVFAALGSSSDDFYGGDRHGKGLFGNSVIALNAGTGSYLWHFQVSHHDLWDYDLPAPPNLVTVRHEGTMVDAVAQLTKQGLVFLLDRETGIPLFPVEERAVPESRVDGESAWPTQPFPLKPPPLVRHSFDESMISTVLPGSRADIEEQIKGYALGEIYTPPSIEGVIQLPGFRGGAEWSSAAFDPEQGMLYVGVNDIPNMVQLVEKQVDLTDPGDIGNFGSLAEFGEKMYQNNCSGCHGEDR